MHSISTLLHIMDKKEEAILYYLYMMADGEVSYGEKKLFDTICKEMELDSDEKRETISKCKELRGNSKDIYSVIIREKIDDEVGNWPFRIRDSGRSRIIWNLVNLGYADSFFSDEERKIVEYFVNKWNIKTEVYQEFIDTADTMLALVKQKEWITSAFPKGKERDLKEKNVDSAFEKLQADIELTIEEMTM